MNRIDEGQDLECPSCGEWTYFPKHDEEIPKFQCPGCRKNVKPKGKVTVTNQDEPFKCEKCKKSVKKGFLIEVGLTDKEQTNNHFHLCERCAQEKFDELVSYVND